MKKYFSFLLIVVFFTAWGCGNSGTNTETTKTDTKATTPVYADTTDTHDSVSRNPDALSDPH